MLPVFRGRLVLIAEHQRGLGSGTALLRYVCTGVLFLRKRTIDVITRVLGRRSSTRHATPIAEVCPLDAKQNVCLSHLKKLVPMLDVLI